MPFQKPGIAQEAHMAIKDHPARLAADVRQKPNNISQENHSQSRKTYDSPDVYQRDLAYHPQMAQNVFPNDTDSHRYIRDNSPLQVTDRKHADLHGHQDQRHRRTNGRPKRQQNIKAKTVYCKVCKSNHLPPQCSIVFDEVEPICYSSDEDSPGLDDSIHVTTV